jgi:hypothetical protein
MSDSTLAGRAERGTAILLALIVTAVLGTGTAFLVPLVTAERALTAAAQDAAQCRYAADGLLEYVVATLQQRSSWAGILDGSAPSALAGDTRQARISGGSLDLDLIGAGLAGFEPGDWGGDRPRWTLVAWGRADALDPRLSGAIHVAAWVADDERDGDGDPVRDTNGRLLVHAEAFGAHRGRRSSRALVARRLAAPAPLRILDWRWP